MFCMITRSGRVISQIMNQEENMIARPQGGAGRRVNTPRFFPNTPIDKYLNMFELAVRSNNWTNEEAHLELCNAVDVSVQELAYSFDNYEDLKAGLKDKLSVTAEEAYLSGGAVLKTQGDTLQMLSLNARSQVAKSYGEYLGVDEDRLAELEVTCFLRSLPSAQMSQIVAMSNPQTLEAALAAAKRYELREKGFAPTQQTTTKKAVKLRQVSEEESDDSPPVWAAEIAKQLTEAQLLAMRAIEIASGAEKKEIACYICGANNHLAAGCLQKRRNATKPNQKSQKQGNE